MAKSQIIVKGYSGSGEFSRSIYAFAPVTKKHQQAEISAHIARAITKDISRKAHDVARDISAELVYAFSGGGE